MEKKKLRRSNLKEYQSATRNRKSGVPGSANIKNILQFINPHYKIGDLFMEYSYGDCSTTITECCSFRSNNNNNNIFYLNTMGFKANIAYGAV